MARQTRRRRMWTAVGMLATLTAITTGAWGLRDWAPFARTPVAITWPHNVQPLVDFVQTETHLRFDRAVNVEFLGDAQAFRRRVAPTTDPTDAARRNAITDEAVGRALGFWSHELDLVAAAATIRGASDFSAAWLRADDTIVVRAKGAEAELSPSERAELIVTLTEVLDDQHFQVADHLLTATTAQQFQALAGLDLGEALWVHDRYVRRFTSADSAKFDTASLDASTAYVNKVGNLPPAFRALRIAAQRLGPAFIAALHERGGDALVANAFTHDTPVALDQLTMPAAKYRRRDHPETIAATAVPEHAQLLSRRQLGPFTVFMIFAGGLPAPEALAASDGWGNDSFAAYRLDGRVCVDGRIVADSVGDADRIERALDAWGHSRPKESSALVGRKGTTLLLSACDPGVGVSQPTVTQAAVDQFFGRADVLANEVASTGQPELAECVATSAFERFAARELDPLNVAVDSAAILDRITTQCNESV